MWVTYLGSWMTTCLGKSCSFDSPRVPFVNCCQFMYLVISLLVLRAGYGIWLNEFLIIAYLFTLGYDCLNFDNSKYGHLGEKGWYFHKRAASSEFGTYRLCEKRRFRRACASAQSRQNLRCSLKQAVSQEEPSDRKPDPWPLWMAGHAQLKFVMTECSKTQIRLTRPKLRIVHVTAYDYRHTIKTQVC